MDTSIPSSNSNVIKAVNHIGVSVPDLDKAIKWYHDVLGFNPITEQIEGTSANSHLGRVLTDIFGADFGKLKLVHMISKNNVGFEVFEFIDPKAERPVNNFEYWKTSFFHICITEPDIEKLTNKIAESGGKQRTKIWELIPGKPYKIAYCEDPFGNIIEIYTHSYQEVWISNKQSNT
jgi:catechol 2,3-dioxygenase-like lactoylglutathione lyase family enzyme